MTRYSKRQMAELWGAGLTAQQIADEVGVTHKVVYQIIHKNRDLFARRPSRQGAQRLVPVFAPKPLPPDRMIFVTKAGYSVTMPRVSILEKR